jgi:hypothetical protein
LGQQLLASFRPDIAPSAVLTFFVLGFPQRLGTVEQSRQSWGLGHAAPSIRNGKL